MACIKVAPAFGKSNLATRKTSPAPRRGSVTVKALKQNASVKHDSYNEHHGPEYFKYAGVDTTPDERARRHTYYDKRTATINQHFPGSIGMDDWLFRIENKLGEFGFTGDNTIAQTNFCRDEITAPLKNGIHDIFGYAMDIDGLAGFTAAGLTGLGAGMSHSPTDPDGRERYVFFAMPHIAVDSAGSPGDCIRAGRAGCGNLRVHRSPRGGLCDWPSTTSSQRSLNGHSVGGFCALAATCGAALVHTFFQGFRVYGTSKPKFFSGQQAHVTGPNQRVSAVDGSETADM